MSDVQFDLQEIGAQLVAHPRWKRMDQKLKSRWVSRLRRQKSPGRRSLVDLTLIKEGRRVDRVGHRRLGKCPMCILGHLMYVSGDLSVQWTPAKSGWWDARYLIYQGQRWIHNTSVPGTALPLNMGPVTKVIGASRDLNFLVYGMSTEGMLAALNDTSLCTWAELVDFVEAVL